MEKLLSITFSVGKGVIDQFVFKNAVAIEKFSCGKIVIDQFLFKKTCVSMEKVVFVKNYYKTDVIEQLFYENNC